MPRSAKRVKTITEPLTATSTRQAEARSHIAVEATSLGLASIDENATRACAPADLASAALYDRTRVKISSKFSTVTHAWKVLDPQKAWGEKSPRILDAEKANSFSNTATHAACSRSVGAQIHSTFHFVSSH